MVFVIFSASVGYVLCGKCMCGLRQVTNKKVEFELVAEIPQSTWNLNAGQQAQSSQPSPIDD